MFHLVFLLIKLSRLLPSSSELQRVDVDVIHMGVLNVTFILFFNSV